jgi:heme/copper-type cytochrome/quinol oxidase subunit 2
VPRGSYPAVSPVTWLAPIMPVRQAVQSACDWGDGMVQEAVRVVNITLTDNSIEPRVVEVPANYPIKFVVRNAGACRHQYALPGIPEFSIDVLPGQTATETFTFVNVGRFEVVSNEDEDQKHGLRGELIVEALF